MSRYYSKTSGELPKKMYIHQQEKSPEGRGGFLEGPYFSKVAMRSSTAKRIEYSLDADGNYIRVIPPEEIKGNKKKLDI